MSSVSIEELRRMVSVDPKAGLLTWRPREPSDFQDTGRGGSLGNCNRWNARYAGKPAFNNNHGDGYLSGQFGDQKILAHRVVWAVVHGWWPDCIDHINGNPADNRLKNLRAVTHQENLRNAKLPVTNSSGHIGVSWNRAERKWKARCRVNNRDIHLGTFDTKAEAIAARKSANQKYGFHDNHGRTAA